MGKRRQVAAIAAFMMVAGLAPAALAGPNEQALLASYIGSWSGHSVMQGGKSPEPFDCRLTVTKGNQDKINYAGRCALADINLTVSGTIAYSDSARQYEAVMRSNAGFNGNAVGRKQGDKIVFDLKERETDKGGNAVRIGAVLELAEKITVDFEVEFNDSGNILTALVPFDR